MSEEVLKRVLEEHHSLTQDNPSIEFSLRGVHFKLSYQELLLIPFLKNLLECSQSTTETTPIDLDPVDFRKLVDYVTSQYKLLPSSSTFDECKNFLYLCDYCCIEMVGYQESILHSWDPRFPDWYVCQLLESEVPVSWLLRTKRKDKDYRLVLHSYAHGLDQVFNQCGDLIIDCFPSKNILLLRSKCLEFIPIRGCDAGVRVNLTIHVNQNPDDPLISTLTKFPYGIECNLNSSENSIASSPIFNEEDLLSQKQFFKK